MSMGTNGAVVFGESLSSRGRLFFCGGEAMLHTVTVVFIALILGFILYQLPFISPIFNNIDYTGMFQISNFLILVYILYLTVRNEKK